MNNGLAHHPWRKSSRSDGGGNCVEVTCVHDASWRKSSRSAQNGQCVEAACVHDAAWHRSSRSSGNGQCVEAAHSASFVAVRDSKLDTIGNFPHLRLSTADWASLLTGIKSGQLTG